MSEERERDKDAVEPEPEDWALNATLTRPDGTTTTTTDFSLDDVTVQRADFSADGVNECSAGLSEAIEDAQQEFQLTVEVPTRTLVCPNCDHPNEVPVWNFVELTFSGELEPLTGEYAVGHQCVQCGFPY